jgi:hypothetical protein
VTAAASLTSKLVQERLELLLRVACTLDHLDEGPARFARLAVGALILVQQHAVDSKGRCRFCTRRRGWRRVRARPCTVHAALGACLTQPDDLVQRQATELLRDHRHASDVTALTRPIPRLSDW